MTRTVGCGSLAAVFTQYLLLSVCPIETEQYGFGAGENLRHDPP